MKSIRTIIISGIILAAFFVMPSCEKENTKAPVEGTWDFYKFCNTQNFSGCIYKEDRDFTEVVEIDGRSFTRYYDDSVAFSKEFSLSDSLMVFGNEEFAQTFRLQNDTLILADTCFECNFYVYVKRK